MKPQIPQTLRGRIPHTEPGFYESLEPYPGAVEALKQLLEAGAVSWFLNSAGSSRFSAELNATSLNSFVSFFKQRVCVHRGCRLLFRRICFFWGGLSFWEVFRSRSLIALFLLPDFLGRKRVDPWINAGWPWWTVNPWWQLSNMNIPTKTCYRPPDHLDIIINESPTSTP